MADTVYMTQKSTLLTAIWESGGNAEETLSRLESGDLQLTGNFRGREAEMVRDARESREAGDWKRNEISD